MKRGKQGMGITAIGWGTATTCLGLTAAAALCASGGERVSRVVALEVVEGPGPVRAAPAERVFASTGEAPAPLAATVVAPAVAPVPPAPLAGAGADAVAPGSAAAPAGEVAEAGAIAPFVLKGLKWLADAQHDNGGWGGGSHAHQNIRNPHQVSTDPATTAFTLTAFIRAGHTPTEGNYSPNVRRAVEHLVAVVETAPVKGPRITEQTGTQPQAKMGPLVDTAMAAQTLARVLPLLGNEADATLRGRVDKALDKCLAKLDTGAGDKSAWTSGGWAPVLQSSLRYTALELAQAAGKTVSLPALQGARQWQKENYDADTGAVRADKAAGVALYAFAGSQRANAGEARAATDLIERAVQDGLLEPEAPVNPENLAKAGVPEKKARELASADAQNRAQVAQLGDERLLAGFGNNGGEEYLSYLMTSESMVIAGGGQWKTWNEKIHRRLAKVQSPDGSWTGHHCITSPVFCTAAVVQCLTTEREAEFLLKVAAVAAGDEPAGTRAAAADDDEGADPGATAPAEPGDKGADAEAGATGASLEAGATGASLEAGDGTGEKNPGPQLARRSR